MFCFQLLWEIKTNWTIQTTLGLIKYEGQNWGAKIEGKKLRGKNWLYAPWLILQSNLFFLSTRKIIPVYFQSTHFPFWQLSRWLLHERGLLHERVFLQSTMYKNRWVVLGDCRDWLCYQTNYVVMCQDWNAITTKRFLWVCVLDMAIPVVEFSREGYKFLAKNQNYQIWRIGVLLQE